MLHEKQKNRLTILAICRLKMVFYEVNVLVLPRFQPSQVAIAVTYGISEIPLSRDGRRLGKVPPKTTKHLFDAVMPGRTVQNTSCVIPHLMRDPLSRVQ